MSLSRRRFVRSAVLTGISTVTAAKGVRDVFGKHGSAEPKALFGATVGSQTGTRLNEATFSQHLNTTFRISKSPLKAVNMELIRVSRRTPPSSLKAAKTPVLDCYSVVFRGPRRTALESGTYPLEHDQMGAFELFISPVSDHTKQRRYEAVFNHLKK